MSTSALISAVAAEEKANATTNTNLQPDEKAKLEADNKRLRDLVAQQEKRLKETKRESQSSIESAGLNPPLSHSASAATSAPITSGSYLDTISDSAGTIKTRIGFPFARRDIELRTQHSVLLAEESPQEPILAEAVPEAIGLFGRIRSAVSGFVFGTPQMNDEKKIIAYKKSKVDIFNTGVVMYSMNIVVGLAIKKAHADKMEDFKTVVGNVDSQAKKYLANHPAFGEDFDYYNIMALARLTLANMFDFSTGNFFTTLNFAIQCMNELIFFSKFIYNANRAGSLKSGLKSLCYDGDTFSWPMFIDNLLPTLAVVLAIKEGITIASLPAWVKEKYDVIKDDLPYTPETGFKGCPVTVHNSVNSCMVATIQAASAILAAKVVPELETLEMIVAAWYGARALTIIAPPVINASAKAISWCRSPSVSAEEGDIENPSTRTGIRYRALNANADES